MTHDTAFGRDRRTDRRYSGAQVEYVFVRHEEDLDNVTFKKGTLRNFSKSGVSISISENPPPETFFLIRLIEPYTPKNSRFIHALGGVIWQQRYQSQANGSITVGIKFLHLDDADAERLDLLNQYYEFKGRAGGRF